MNRFFVSLGPGRPLVTVLLFSLVLAACAGGGALDDGADGRGGGGGGTESSEPIEHPDGSELVLRMDSAGGFVPREFALSAVPAFTLLGDGRVITVGAQFAIFPGPALPNLEERRLSEEGIQEVLRLVAASGLFSNDAEFSGASNFVADAATTTFTVNAGGRTVTVSIYGLGTLADGGPGLDLPAAERVAHERLQQLSERLTGLESWLPATAWAEAESRPHVPEALRLYVRNADADPPDPSGIEPDVRSWPLGVPLAEFGEEPTQDSPDLRCAVVEGDDAVRLLDELGQASQLTRWESEESVYALLVRPLLPDEPRSCP